MTSNNDSIIINPLDKIKNYKEYHKLMYIKRKENGYFENRNILLNKEKKYKKNLTEDEAVELINKQLEYQRNYQRVYQKQYIQNKKLENFIKLNKDEIEYTGKKGRPRLYKII